MDTGQFYPGDSLASNYTRQLFIKADPQGYVLPAFVQAGASTHPNVPAADILLTYYLSPL